MSDLIIKYGGESPFIIKTNRMFSPLDVHSIGECGIVGGWIYCTVSGRPYFFTGKVFVDCGKQDVIDRRYIKGDKQALYSRLE